MVVLGLDPLYVAPCPFIYPVLGPLGYQATTSCLGMPPDPGRNLALVWAVGMVPLLVVWLLSPTSRVVRRLITGGHGGLSQPAGVIARLDNSPLTFLLIGLVVGVVILLLVLVVFPWWSSLQMPIFYSVPVGPGIGT
jgi:hypothetical protein